MFLDELKLERPKIDSTRENGWGLILPHLILAIGSIFIGFITKELILGPIIPCMVTFNLKWLPSCLVLAGIVSGVLLFYNVKLVSSRIM